MPCPPIQGQGQDRALKGRSRGSVNLRFPLLTLTLTLGSDDARIPHVLDPSPMRYEGTFPFVPTNDIHYTDHVHVSNADICATHRLHIPLAPQLHSSALAHCPIRQCGHPPPPSPRCQGITCSTATKQACDTRRRAGSGSFPAAWVWVSETDWLWSVAQWGKGVCQVIGDTNSLVSWGEPKQVFWRERLCLGGERYVSGVLRGYLRCSLPRVG